MAAEVALNVPRGGGDVEEFMVINAQRCPRLMALFKQGQRLSTRHLDGPQVCRFTREPALAAAQCRCGPLWGLEWALTGGSLARVTPHPTLPPP